MPAFAMATGYPVGIQTSVSIYRQLFALLVISVAIVAATMLTQGMG
jgi:hypothetical protein